MFLLNKIDSESISVFSYVPVFLIIFFYLYNTTLNVYGSGLSLSGVAVAAGLFLSFRKFLTTRASIFKTHSFFIFIAIVSIFFVYAASVEIFYSLSGGHYYFSRIVLNIIISSIFCLVFSTYLIRSGFYLSHVMKLIFYIGLINSIVVLLSFFISDFRLFLETFMFQQKGSNIDYMAVDWRLRGVAAAGGASLSLFTAFCIVIGIVCNKMKLLSSNIVLFCSIVMLASQFFIARTGLMVALFFIMLWFLSDLRKFRASFFIVILCIFIFLHWFYFEYNEQISRVLPFALELFYNLFSGSGASTGSTNELLDMLYFPDNIYYFIFGFGCFEGCIFYRSDSGYFKSISAVGIFFSLILYLSLFYLLFFWFKKFISNAVYFWSSFVIVLFIFEIKEPFIYQNYLSRALILLLSMAFVQCRMTRLKID